MKILKHFGLFLFFATIVTTLAMRPIQKKDKVLDGKTFTFQYFKLNNPGTDDPKDPANYTAYTGDPSDEGDCPNAEYVCVIYTDEIYSVFELTNPGKPKVDDDDSGGNTIAIDDDIDTAIGSPTTEDGEVQASGNIVYLKD